GTPLLAHTTSAQFHQRNSTSNSSKCNFYSSATHSGHSTHTLFRALHLAQPTQLHLPLQDSSTQDNSTQHNSTRHHSAHLLQRTYSGCSLQCVTPLVGSTPLQRNLFSVTYFSVNTSVQFWLQLSPISAPTSVLTPLVALHSAQSSTSAQSPLGTPFQRNSHSVHSHLSVISLSSLTQRASLPLSAIPTQPPHSKATPTVQLYSWNSFRALHSSATPIQGITQRNSTQGNSTQRNSTQRNSFSAHPHSAHARLEQFTSAQPIQGNSTQL
ncbi:hypothetical protein AVEN_13356-1, partial [Araneus ventricosus]